MSTPLLVSTGWLADHLNNADVRVVDARWYLLDPDRGERDYAAAHIPNALYLHIDRHLAAPPEPGAVTGRHPLPTAEAFAATMAQAGIASARGNQPGTHVVAYDDMGGINAARLWWLLGYFGHERASLLDGGLNQWRAEGRALTSAIPTFPPSQFDAEPKPNWIVNKAEMVRRTRDPHTLILDARAPERYRGETEPVDARAGHIPGARSAPGAGNLRGEGDFRFKNAAELRARFDALGANGADDIVAYCGSGVNAAQDVFALWLAGYDNTRLYPGSFSEWSRDPGLPVITGAAPD